MAAGASSRVRSTPSPRRVMVACSSTATSPLPRASATRRSTVLVPMSMVATRMLTKRTRGRSFVDRPRIQRVARRGNDPHAAFTSLDGAEVQHLLDVRLHDELDAAIALHVVVALLVHAARDRIGLGKSSGAPVLRLEPAPLR